MRFVWAVAAFVVAALMIGLGIAQRTIFQAPPAASTAVPVGEDEAYTVIDGEVLNLFPGAQTLTAEGDGTVFAAYGRTADVQAWLADVPYNLVTVGSEGALRTEVIEPETDGDAGTDATATPAPPDAAAPTEPAPAGEEADAAARTPVGSDLWLDEFQQERRLSTPLKLPDTMSVLVAADGAEPAPSEIALTWPVDRSTPWAGPLIVGGGVILVVGVVLYILGIRHVRRSRGPRRKGLPLAVTEPIDLAVEGSDKGVISAGAPSRRRGLPGRRTLVALPAVAVSGLLFVGCSSEAWPQLPASETPSPTATVIVPEGQQPPAVTESQAKRIVTRISESVAEADAAMDPAAAGIRLGGTALAERETNYALRGALPDLAPLPVIPDSPVEIVLPQQFEGWPRSFMTVVEDADDSTVAPTIMLMTQDDPWSEYKATFIASLEAATLLPDLPATYVGAPMAPPDSPFLRIQPDQLAAAYADIIDNGQNSPYWGDFDVEGDLLLPSIAQNRQQRLDEFNQTGSSTASLSFQATAGNSAPMALTTLDGGAIVAVDVFENDTVKPTNPDAVIRLDGNAQVKTLTGLEQSAKGFATTYVDQLFFYVPLEGSNDPIRLLGYRSNILQSKEIE
ncbi:glycosyl transferase [Microbacterium sp. RD1]|uniref:glycosyl transferase n=1 Tax=Microbacterium sp. RD1 TaxID=3457313 RepID=UPI003FA5E148